jgi:hypothetical protein
MLTKVSYLSKTQGKKLLQSTQVACFQTSQALKKPEQMSYQDNMYSQWKADPSSVHASWATYFES